MLVGPSRRRFLRLTNLKKTHPVGEHGFGSVIGPQVASRGVEKTVVWGWNVWEEAGHIFIEPDQRGSLAGLKLLRYVDE